jgi:EAL domain-containing protein (putative c-di-GMP-specific phosphodiesterase class I)
MNRGAVALPGLFGLAPARGVRTLLAALRSWPLEHPGGILAAGAFATTFLIVLQVTNTAGLSWLAERAHLLVSSGVAVLALVVVARRPGAQVLDYRRLALASVVTGAGLAGAELVPVLGGSAAMAANVLIVVGAGLALTVILPALYRFSDGRAQAAAVLDSLIMTAAVTAVVVTIWLSLTGRSPGVDELLVPILASCLLASSWMPVIAAFSRRIAPAPRGIWCAIVAAVVLASSWIFWLDSTLNGRSFTEIISLSYSVGILLLAWGWISWTETPGHGQVYLAVAQRLIDWMPAFAIVLCATVVAVPHEFIGPVDPAYVGMIVVVFLTLIRQRMLTLNERLSSRMLAREIEERGQTMLSLSRLEPGDTIEATAARICGEAMRLDGIEAAAVYAFGPSASVVPLSLNGFGARDELVGEPVDAGRARRLQACADIGAWVDSPVDPAAHPAARTPAAAPSGVRSEPGVGEAFAPMRWDDRVVGVVAMGAVDEEQVRRLPDRLSTMSEFGVVSAALLGPMLSEHWRMADLRSQLEDLIGSRAFWPVFQSVVRLTDRKPVGYEALTRFADGSRPDERFAQANAAGMTVRFETACLQAQLEAACWLPAGVWVSLNVSPTLATAVVPLISVVEQADRDVVIEITEHVEIGDYEALGYALDLVRGRVRLAVDDAGAGYAGLRHILELRPQFVKLDLSLVRNVDTDRARQAMVAGMAYFAHDSGCELIAEGIETEGELAELVRLGVTYGQGYLFGKPERLGRAPRAGQRPGVRYARELSRPGRARSGAAGRA